MTARRAAIGFAGGQVLSLRLSEAGLSLIDEIARTGIRSSRVAFLHPRSTGGVLTEIVQPAEVHA